MTETQHEADVLLSIYREAPSHATLFDVLAARGRFARRGLSLQTIDDCTSTDDLTSLRDELAPHGWRELAEEVFAGDVEAPEFADAVLDLWLRFDETNLVVWSLEDRGVAVEELSDAVRAAEEWILERSWRFHDAAGWAAEEWRACSADLFQRSPDLYVRSTLHGVLADEAGVLAEPRKRAPAGRVIRLPERVEARQAAAASGAPGQEVGTVFRWQGAGWEAELDVPARPDEGDEATVTLRVLDEDLELRTGLEDVKALLCGLELPLERSGASVRLGLLRLCWEAWGEERPALRLWYPDAREEVGVLA